MLLVDMEEGKEECIHMIPHSDTRTTGTPTLPGDSPHHSSGSPNNELSCSGAARTALHTLPFLQMQHQSLIACLLQALKGA